jgi:hypothetical protein
MCSTWMSCWASKADLAGQFFTMVLTINMLTRAGMALRSKATWEKVMRALADHFLR